MVFLFGSVNFRNPGFQEGSHRSRWLCLINIKKNVFWSQRDSISSLLCSRTSNKQGRLWLPKINKQFFPGKIWDVWKNNFTLGLHDLIIWYSFYYIIWEKHTFASLYPLGHFMTNLFHFDGNDQMPKKATVITTNKDIVKLLRLGSWINWGKTKSERNLEQNIEEGSNNYQL